MKIAGMNTSISTTVNTDITNNDETLPVVFCPAAQDACAFYRMYIPHLNLPRSDYYFTGWKPDGTPAHLDLRRVLDKKVVIVQRQASIHNLKAIVNMKMLGLKVIYDLDDNLWNLPHGNPAKRAMEIHRDGFAMCTKEADMITVSTQGLKTAASTALTQNTEILIVPNAIDFKLFKKKEIQRDDGTVLIGWGGSNTHTDDVKEVFDIIPDVLNACPNARMEIVGAPAKKEEKQQVKILRVLEHEENGKMVPYALLVEDVKSGMREEYPWQVFTPNTERMIGKTMSRYVLLDSKLAQHGNSHFRSWAPIREYPNRFSSWGWDIAIAPLEDYRFNKSKSNIKMLEAAAVQIPCLVSNVQPYYEFCSLGGSDLMWLLCSKVSEWKSKLITLVNEPERRDFLGKKMYDITKKYYDIDVVRNHWNYVFKKAWA